MSRPTPRARVLRRAGAAMLGVTALSLGPLALPAQAAPVEIDLLTMNDFHGRLETSGSVGGAAVLAGAANAFRAANPNTVLVGAGDLIGASTFVSFIQDDNPTIDALNATGLDVSSVGNHEYDQGWADLRDDVIGGSDGHAAEWPYLASNVVLDATGEPAPETPPYQVIETGGVRIGYVGAVTEDLPSLVSPAGIEELEVLPIVESVNAVAAGLSDGDETNGEADVVVLLVHEDATGAIEDGASDDIDAIVAGHSHETYAYQQPSGRPVIQTGQYATNIGHLNLSVDPDTDEITVNVVENLPLMTCDAEGVCTPNYEPDAEVAQIVADAVAAAEELGAVELGTVTQNITRAFDIVEDPDLGPVLTEDRGEESTLGNLVADAQRVATATLPTGEAQIAFMNPGGLRADLCYAQADYPYEEDPNAPDVDNVCVGVPDDGGVITYKDAATVQPFANTLVRMSLTGAQIEAVLEQQLQPPDASRPFLHLGVSEGFEYTYDITRDATGVPTEFDVVEMTLDGVAVDAASSYEIVANSFLAAGGDNFTTFAEATDAQDSGVIDLETFVDYMADFSPVSPDLQERAIDLALIGEATIDWPAALGDPPAMRAGTTKTWELGTDLPLALTEGFELTVEAPDGVTVAPTALAGIPAGTQTVPFDVVVDEATPAGDYELVFTLDRVDNYSVFDANPLPTPTSITVELHISAAGSNPGGPIDTGLSAPAGNSSTGLLVGLGVLASLAICGLVVVQRREMAPRR